jgi:WD40 repeat protein
MRSDPQVANRLLQDAAACPLYLQDFTWGLLQRACVSEADGLSALTASEAQAALGSPILHEPGNAAAFDHRLIIDPSGNGVTLENVETGQRRTLAAYPVWSAAFSRDGTSVALVGDGFVEKWSPPWSGEPHRVNLQGADGPVGASSLSTDLAIVVATVGSSVCVWETAAGRIRDRIPFRWEPPIALAISPSHDLIYWVTGNASRQRQASQWVQEIVTWDRTRRAWAGSAEVPVDDLGAARDMVLSTDGRTLATGHGLGEKGLVVLWDSVTLDRRLVLPQTEHPVHALSFLHDGRLLAARTRAAPRFGQFGDREQPVYWHANEWRRSVTMRGHRGPVFGVSFSPSGTMVAASSGYAQRETYQVGEVKLWDIETSEARTVFREFDNSAYTAVFSADERHLAVRTKRALLLHQTDDLDEPTRVEGVYGRLLSFLPGGDQIAVSAGSGVSMIDVRSGQEIAGPRLSNRRRASVEAMTRDGEDLLLSDSDGMEVWRPSSPEGRIRLRGAVISEAGMLSKAPRAAFSPDSEYVVAMREDGGVALWSAVTGEIVAPLEGSSEPVKAVAFSPDGAMLAAVTGEKRREGTIHVWDVNSRQLLGTLRAEQHSPLCVAFSPDGKLLASGGLDAESSEERGEIRLWNLQALTESAGDS